MWQVVFANVSIETRIVDQYADPFVVLRDCSPCFSVACFSLMVIYGGWCSKMFFKSFHQRF